MSPVRFWPIAFALAVLPTLPIHAQFSVFPVNVDLRGDTGTASEVIHVRNDGTETLHVTLSVDDFDMTPAGEHKFASLGTLEESCGERIRFFPSELNVAPGSTETVRVEMGAGERVCWSLLWVTNSARTVVQGASIGTRIGVKAYGTPSQAQPAGSLSDGRVEEVQGKSYLHVTLKNTGSAVMRPAGRVEIYAEGQVVKTLPVSTFTVLPGREYHYRIELPELPAGNYLVLPGFDYGGEYILATRVNWVIQ